MVNKLTSIKVPLVSCQPQELLAAGGGVLGHGLGALGDSVLGQLPGKKEPHGSLDLPGGDGGLLVVVSQAGLGSNLLKQIVDEGVHDAHSLGGHTSVRMNLFQHLREKSSTEFKTKIVFDAHLVDVDCVGLLPLSFLLFLLALGHSLGSFARLDGGLPRGLRRHGIVYEQ